MIKKYYRKLYRAWLGKPLQKEDFQFILKNLLGLKKGDSVLVHASFGNLKPGFSPEVAVEILMETVSVEGNLLMPYYPSNSVNWLKEGKVFDVRSTPTRSGILSATFSNFPGVKKSLHPTKSLAIWGKNRDYLISEHHYSQTPFDIFSPYGKLLNFSNAKSVGLGVFKYSGMHAYEDNINDYPKYYSAVSYKGKVIDYSGKTIIVKTPFHISNNATQPCEYLKLTNCPEYVEIKFKKRRYYVSDYMLAFNHIKYLFVEKGLTAIAMKDKQSVKSIVTSKLVRI